MNKRQFTNQEDYVNSQHIFNATHRDGTIVSVEEEALKYSHLLCKKLKEMRIASPSILDAGCRMGYCLPVYAEHFPDSRILGIDIVPEFIEIAALAGDAQVADIHDLPFEDQEFDVSFSCQVMEHCHDLKKAINELLRVTKLITYISVPIESPPEFSRNQSHYIRISDPINWLKLFQRKDWMLMNSTYENKGNYFNFMMGRLKK